MKLVSKASLVSAATTIVVLALFKKFLPTVATKVGV